MADYRRINDLTAETNPASTDVIPIDGATTRKVTRANILKENLEAIRALTSAANKGIKFTGSGTAATYDLTAAGEALLDDADAAAQRTTLGLGNVNNTSDANKPVSTATQTALDLKANISDASTMATLCLTFDTYRSAYENAALTFMTDLGLVGTQFIMPEQLDTTGGANSFSADEFAILMAKGWEIGAYGSNSTVTANLSDLYIADRTATFARLAEIRSLFLAKGIDVKSLAPMQRQWSPQLREMAFHAGFKVVRAANEGLSGAPIFAPYPIVDPLNVHEGGDALSMNSTTTASYLEGILDQAIADKGLMVTVTHEVNTPTDGSTVDPQVLEDFLTYANGKQDLGLLRITTLSKAMTAA